MISALVLLVLLSTAAAATASASSSTTACGPNTPFTMYGSVSVVPVAQKWAKSYETLCGYSNQITVTSATANTANGRNAQAAQAVCGVGSGGSGSGSTTPTSTDIGLLSRPLLAPTEAIPSVKNAYLYTCAKGSSTTTTTTNNRITLTQVQVAIDGIAFITALSSIASRCIASLPGSGLTFSQVRWIYSSFPLSKLLVDPLFDANAIPNSDGKDSTHLWSELCVGSACDCPAIEIDIAGSPPTSGTYAFFIETFFVGNNKGETFRSVYQSDPYDSPTFVVNLITTSGNGDTLGYTSFVNYNNNANRVSSAAIEDPIDGVYRFPTFAQFASGEYPASFYLYMAVSNAILPVVQAFFAYAYSDAGNADVSSTGLLPLTGIRAVQMLSRLGAPGGVSLAGIACGPNGNIFMGGSSTVYPVASLWGNVYADACGIATTVISGGSTLGAQLACGIPLAQSTQLADIGNMSRQFLSKEAVLSDATGYDYKCLIGVKRAVREFPVAIDGITFAFSLNGAAAKCLPTLAGKGLTVDQLRWMYSSYTYAQLVANGWDKTSLPNYDGNDATHYWSELGGSGCPAVEIFIAGSPNVAGTYQYFVSTTMTGVGETIAITRPAGYFNVPYDDPDVVVAYLQQTSPSIGFFGYSYYEKNTKTLGAASIKNKAGIFIPPTQATFIDGSYNPYTRLVYMQLVTVFLTFQKTSAFVKFGTSTAVGDTLAIASGLFPLSTANKNLIKPRFTLSVPCFAATNTVHVWNKGIVYMNDLKIGDQVMNAQGKFDAVYSFGHYSHDIEAEFIQIQASGLAKPLEISKEHMLLLNGAFLPASAIAAGDAVHLYNGSVAKVTKVITVARQGAYAPFTMSGTIAVNDVAASSYVDLQNKEGILWVGGYKTPFSMQFLAHMFQAPHRLVCKMSSAFCQTETYNEMGVSVWVAGPLEFAEWAIRQSGIITSCVFTLCFLVGFFIYVIESMTTTFGGWCFLMACLLLLSCRSAKKVLKKV